MKDQWFSRIEPELETDGSYRLVPRGDEFVVYARFVAHSDTVSLHVEVDGDGARCRAVEIRGERLTSDDLRLPLKRLLKHAVAAAAIPIFNRDSDVQRFATVAGQNPPDRDFYRQYVGDTDYRPRRGKRVTDEHLQRVADMYKAAMERGDHPTQTIARELRFERPTVSRWIARARDRGMLGPALRGKAGEGIR